MFTKTDMYHFIEALSSTEPSEASDLDNSNLSASPYGESPVAFSPFGHSLSSQEEDEGDDSVNTDGMESGEEGDYDQGGYPEYDMSMNGDSDGMFLMDDEVRCCCFFCFLLFFCREVCSAYSDIF